MGERDWWHGSQRECSSAKIIPTYSLNCYRLWSFWSSFGVSADSSGSFIWFFFFRGERNTRTRAILLSPATLTNTTALLSKPSTIVNWWWLSWPSSVLPLSRYCWPTWPDNGITISILCVAGAVAYAPLYANLWSGRFLPLAMLAAQSSYD